MPAYCITVDAGKAMTQRASMMHSTIDFGRPYKDIGYQRHDWLMENWLHWIELDRDLLCDGLTANQAGSNVL